jgi:predicted RNA-binding Zn-ribbon protein involved in translation (DUF1610 family)
MYLDRDDVKGLWRNTRNSMYHAFEHFSELATNGSDKEHHHKWIVLSVHHAAECFLKILLKELDPTDSYVKDSKGRVRFPNLIDILLALRKLEHAGRLSRAEQKLLDLLDEINRTRNEIIHRDFPNDLDASVAAYSMLAILRAASRRWGISLEALYSQDPPIEISVVESIHWQRSDDYKAFVEESLKDEHPEIQFFHQCPYCGANAITARRCEACFQEMELKECPSCGHQFYIPSDRRLLAEEEYRCPCGAL